MLTITEDLIMSGIAYSRDVFVSEKSEGNDRRMTINFTTHFSEFIKTWILPLIRTFMCGFVLTCGFRSFR